MELLLSPLPQPAPAFLCQRAATRPCLQLWTVAAPRAQLAASRTPLQGQSRWMHLPGQHHSTVPILLPLADRSTTPDHARGVPQDCVLPMHETTLSWRRRRWWCPLPSGGKLRHRHACLPSSCDCAIARTRRFSTRSRRKYTLQSKDHHHPCLAVHSSTGPEQQHCGRAAGAGASCWQRGEALDDSVDDRAIGSGLPSYACRQRQICTAAGRALADSETWSAATRPRFYFRLLYRKSSFRSIWQRRCGARGVVRLSCATASILIAPFARTSAVSYRYTVRHNGICFDKFWHGRTRSKKKGDRKCAHESVWCHTHLHWINDVERTKAPKRTHDTSTAFCCISANTKWCASIAGAKRRRSARKTRCELSIVAEGTKSDIVSIKESNQFPSVSNLYYLQFLRLRFSVKKREVLQRGPGIFLIRQASAKARYLTAQPITV